METPCCAKTDKRPKSTFHVLCYYKWPHESEKKHWKDGGVKVRRLGRTKRRNQCLLVLANEFQDPN